MMEDPRLKQLLSGQCGNYMIPFFWQHGEDEKTLRLEIRKIQESGCQAFCVESRPHPDFLGDTWWRDMDLILEEAGRLGMQVYLLDDLKFPTGFCAGAIRDKYPHLKKWLLAERHTDALGPAPGSSFLVDGQIQEGEQLLGAVAVSFNGETGGDSDLGDISIDLTSHIKDGMLYWDVPSGFWRVFFLVMTRDGGNPSSADYLNHIDPESSRVLLDTVYEPHYSRYSHLFGTVFAGFFSDEPQFGNASHFYIQLADIGRCPMALPWRLDLLEILEAKWSGEALTSLPYLWYGGSVSPAVRQLYMDVVTDLYSQCFTQQLGSWCREHGVEYIGHVVEDNGVHARLGMGTGHYFRALKGQDRAGIDVVLQQIRPGFDIPFRGITRVCSGEFYHYGLARLGASLGHLDPLKKGRAFCEIYGAYGWYEGLKLMKWLTDHMMVRGINSFVPHAFSPKEFPDPDCPPHFYAGGNHPQYRFFKGLADYTNRICHLLEGADHMANAAVLYHAEAEWSGEYMPFEKPAKILTQNQIEFDVVPIDFLLENGKVADGKLRVAKEQFQCLIIPYAQRLPRRLLEWACNAAQDGLTVYFINSTPDGSCEGDRFSSFKSLHSCPVIPLNNLAEQLLDMRDVKPDSYQPWLRSYHCRRGSTEYTFFFNEHPSKWVDTSITFPSGNAISIYDPWRNALEQVSAAPVMPLHLSPYQSLLAVSQDEAASTPKDFSYLCRRELERYCKITSPWEVSFSNALDYPVFTQYSPAMDLKNMALPDALPHFSGTFRYETTFTIDHPLGSPLLLDLGEVYETAEVWLDGVHLGVRICPPYRFDLHNLPHGEHHLRIEVTNPLVYQQRDFMSKFAQLEPSGLLGPVQLLKIC